MSRLVPALCFGCVIALGATTYGMLGDGAADHLAVPKLSSPATSSGTAASAMATALRDARRTCSLPALDDVVLRLRTQTGESSADREAWHLLAEALLERVLQRSHLRGMTVGAPIYPELPREVAEDLEAGLAAAARARELGDDSSDLYRIEAGLMGQRITGLGPALQWNGRIQQALAKAGERASDNPHLHVALGLRKLLVPPLLGQDPQKALEHFEFAAKALADDERPAVFAAMANFVQKKRLLAISWLEQAVARNPNNTFARVVLRRLRRGEDDPFGRDVTAAEAAEGR